MQDNTIPTCQSRLSKHDGCQKHCKVNAKGTCVYTGGSDDIILDYLINQQKLTVFLKGVCTNSFKRF